MFTLYSKILLLITYLSVMETFICHEEIEFNTNYDA